MSANLSYEKFEEQDEKLGVLLAAIVRAAIKEQIRKTGEWTVCNLGSGDFDDDVVKKFGLQLDSVGQKEEGDELDLQFKFVGDIEDEFVELGWFPFVTCHVSRINGDVETFDADDDLGEIYHFRTSKPYPWSLDANNFKQLEALYELLSKRYLLLLMSQ